MNLIDRIVATVTAKANCQLGKIQNYLINGPLGMSVGEGRYCDWVNREMAPIPGQGFPELARVKKGNWVVSGIDEFSAG